MFDVIVMIYGDVTSVVSWIPLKSQRHDDQTHPRVFLLPYKLWKSDDPDIGKHLC